MGSSSQLSRTRGSSHRASRRPPGRRGPRRAPPPAGLCGQFGGLPRRRASVDGCRRGRVIVGSMRTGWRGLRPFAARCWSPLATCRRRARGWPGTLHAMCGHVFGPARRLPVIEPLVGLVERSLDTCRITGPHGRPTDDQRFAFGVDQGRRRRTVDSAGATKSIGSGSASSNAIERISLVQRHWVHPAEDLHAVAVGDHPRADQLTWLQLAARSRSRTTCTIAGAHVPHGDALTAEHLFDLEHRAIDEQPLLGQSPLVGGQQEPAHLEESANAPPSNSTTSITNGSV